MPSVPNSHASVFMFCFCSQLQRSPCFFVSLWTDCSLARHCVPAWRRGSVQDNSGRIMPTAGVVAAATAVTACYPAGEMAPYVPLLIWPVLPSFLPSFPFFPSSASIQLIFSPSHVLTSHSPFHQPSLTALVVLSAFSSPLSTGLSVLLAPSRRAVAMAALARVPPRSLKRQMIKWGVRGSG